MLQAITTKYLGPTNHRGSRIVAQCNAKRIVVEWDDSLDVAENHTRAAQNLATQLGWDGPWHGGALPESNSHAYCFVQSCMKLF